RLRRCARPHVAVLRPGERRAGRPLQLTPGRRHPRQLLPEPPRRGEPGARPGLDLRGEPDHALPGARQPAEERRPVSRLAAIAVACLVAAAAALLARAPSDRAGGAGVTA